MNIYHVAEDWENWFPLKNMAENNVQDSIVLFTDNKAIYFLLFINMDNTLYEWQDNWY